MALTLLTYREFVTELTANRIVGLLTFFCFAIISTGMHLFLNIITSDSLELPQSDCLSCILEVLSKTKRSHLSLPCALTWDITIVEIAYISV